ncbi:MAG: tetratricopeptide repeat protein [Planctomycetaceae bacterium]|nr:tetratricopeptide repeat protein [Planctomycetaceae bacterium]
MPQQSNRDVRISDFKLRILISICLAVAIFAVYWQVYSFDFIRFDDGDYITRNVHIRSGLNWETIRWAFTSSLASNWHPLTWLSHALDYQLFKNWAGGYHLVNVWFHFANTILLFYVLLRAAKAVWPAALVAALFALHPLHVESVAWISERKDLLSTMFWLLTMLTYVWYVEKQNAVRYLITLVLFVLGLISKPMLVTLPFVLLLFDYWPLERKFSVRLLAEKIPFFICAFAVCVVTYIVQKSGGSVSLFRQFSLSIRIKNVFVSYVDYIWKMFYPENLAILYPHPGDNISAAKAVICAIVLICITAAVLYFGRKRKFLISGWLWYLGTLVPVIGIVQVGAQAMADRYTYMTLTGLFIMIVWSVKEFVPAKNYKLAAAAAGLVLVSLTVDSIAQLQYWKNSQSLFGRAIEVTKNNYMMLDNYGSILVEQGKARDAIKCFKQSQEIYPESPMANNNLGCALQEIGNFKNAETYFRLAIKNDPNFIHPYINLANNLKRQNKPEEINDVLTQAAKLPEMTSETYTRFGRIFFDLQKYELAIGAFDKAIKLDSENIDAYGRRSLAFNAIGKIDEAINDVRFVLKARPKDVMMYRNLGIFLERKGNIADAIEAYRAGLQVEPNNENLRQLLEEDLKTQTGH